MNESQTLIAIAEADEETRNQATAELELSLNLLLGGSEEIERILDRKVVSRGTITEYHTFRRWTEKLWLEQWPVFVADPTATPAIAAPVIHEDTFRDYGATTLLVEGEDYLVDYDSGCVTRISGDSEIAWLTGLEVVKVVYRGGYTQATVPGDLKRIASELFAMQFYEKVNKRVGMASASDDLGSRTFYGPAELTSHQIDRLERHRRISFGGRTMARSTVAA